MTVSSSYEIAGLPAHVLLVHVVVIATPLLAVLLVVLAVWPAARRVLWLAALIGAALLVPTTLLTVQAGEWLEARVPTAPLIEAHTSMGDDIVPWVIALFVVALALGVWQVVSTRAARRGRPFARGRNTIAVSVLALAALIVGVGATWTVVQIGESGSRAVWEGGFSNTPLER